MATYAARAASPALLLYTCALVDTRKLTLPPPPTPPAEQPFRADSDYCYIQQPTASPATRLPSLRFLRSSFRPPDLCLPHRSLSMYSYIESGAQNVPASSVCLSKFYQATEANFVRSPRKRLRYFRNTTVGFPFFFSPFLLLVLFFFFSSLLLYSSCFLISAPPSPTAAARLCWTILVYREHVPAQIHYVYVRPRCTIPSCRLFRCRPPLRGRCPPSASSLSRKDRPEIRNLSAKP